MNKFYGVLILFDEKGNSFVQNLWQKIADAGITGAMSQIENCKPHLSLALYQGCSVDLIEKKAKEFAEEHNSFEIQFSSFGLFTTPMRPFFLGVTRNEPLNSIHTKWHEKEGLCENEANTLYKPDSWVPHITLSMGINKFNYEEALECVFETHLPFNCMATTIAITEFDMTDGALVWKYHNIFNFRN